jgi:hypothetical protein
MTHKPCLWCGSMCVDADIVGDVPYGRGEFWAVECANCDARGPRTQATTDRAEGEAEAWRLWDERDGE